MDLRPAFQDALKTAMRAHDAPRTSTLRMILARIKDADIAARPTGVTAIPDDQIIAALRAMVKSRRESIALYTQGNRPELAAKEQAEIDVIDTFLPQQLDEAATTRAVTEAIATTQATTVKDMGRIMTALKSSHGATLDMALVNRLVKSALSA